MIILEGTDLVGKTTLAKRLVELLDDRGYIYRHLSRLPDAFDRYHGYARLMSRCVVHDRFHMSEVVYSYARGDRSTKLCPETYRLVDAKLRLVPALTVVVTAADASLVARHRERAKDEMYDAELVLRANEAFKTIAQKGMFTYGDRRYNDMDVDVWLACTNDFPSEKHAMEILELYERRLTTWSEINGRRETISL